MYFLVNSQNYIIAASDKFLQNVGSREFFSLSSMLKEHLIQIDEENSKIKIKDNEYNFSKSILHSCFGNITLFKVYEVKESLLQTEDESNIELLRKIKQKAIEKEDNEFEIPTIPSLQKDELATKENDLIKEIEAIKVEKKDTDKTEKTNIQVPKELLSKEEIKETINKVTPSIDIENVKEIAPKIVHEEKLPTKKLTPPPISEEILKASLEEESLIQEEKLKVPTLETQEIQAPTLEKKVDLEENEMLKQFNEKLINIETQLPKEKELDKEFEEKLEFEEEKKVDESIIQEIEKIDVKKEAQLKEEKEEFIPLVTPKDFETLEKEPKEKLKETTPLLTPQDFKPQEENKKAAIENKEFAISKEETKKEVLKEEKPKLQKEISFSINLEQNAANLKIDINTYKMLLKNFLSEIESNFNKIKQANSQTIKMLIDAGNLLALENLSKMLSEQMNNPSPQNLEHIKSYINFLYEEIALSSHSFKDEKQTQEISQEVDESLIDITSDEELLKLIKAKDAEFDPKEVEEELGLPLDLIGNFIQDFILQAKEHLPIFVEAYHNKNLEELKIKAHMLKGAASNLRIKAVAATLKALEESSDFDEIASLIKDFVGEIKGLENDYEKLFT